MSIKLNFNYELLEADVAFWEVNARVHAVAVEHARDWPCRTFDSTPPHEPGVFRTVGRVRFNKNTRCWTALVCSDCNAEEATLAIAAAVGMASRWGMKPGQRIRQRAFEHFNDGSGDPVAETRVCYRLSVEDLQQTATANQEAPDTIEALAHLVDEHYVDLLRQAREVTP